MFKNRADAGKKMAKLLMKYRGANTVVYAIPRGGVIVGRAIADELESPLDIVVTRKLVYPDDVNHAFGAIDEQGNEMIDKVESDKIAPELVHAEIERQQSEVKRRAKMYRMGKEPIGSKDKIAIIVDDSITTGYNIRPAVQFIKLQNPKKIVVAIPVAPRDSLEKIRGMVDEIVILIQPEIFAGSAEKHYVEFAQPEDTEIISALIGPKKKEKQKPFKADINLTEPGHEPFFSTEN